MNKNTGGTFYWSFLTQERALLCYQASRSLEENEPSHECYFTGLDIDWCSGGVDMYE